MKSSNKTNDIQIFSRPVFSAKINFEPLDVITAVETGGEYIYLVDEAGRYTNQTIVGKFFYKIWEKDFRCIVPVPSVICESEDNALEATLQIKELFQTKPFLDEIPLLDSQQRIIACFGKREYKTQEAKLKWRNVVFDDKLRKYIAHNYRRIYLTTLENEEMFSFYNEFANFFPSPLHPLTVDNLQSALEDDDCLLLYANDIFPIQTRKMSIYDLWNKNFELNAELVTILPDAAIISESDAFSSEKIIKKFDEGYKSIAIADDRQNYAGIIALSTFANHFPKKKFPIYTNLFLELEDEKTLKHKVAEMCLGTAKEIPILDHGKVVATGCQNNHTTELPVCWDFIRDETVEKFFHGKRRILISSDTGILAEFKKRFKHLLSIEVYKDDLLQRYLIGDYDALIYGADVWRNSPTEKISAKKLYGALLMTEIREYLKGNGIRHYYLGLTMRDFDSRRIQMSDVENNITPSLRYIEGINGYFIFNDIHRSDIVNITNGRRLVPDTPTQNDDVRYIYVFGPCTAVSAFTDDKNSFANKLQILINAEGSNWKVINCGATSSNEEQDICNLNYIMDTPIKSGSIVLTMGYIEPWYFENLSDEFYFELPNILNRREHIYDKIYHDRSMRHLNEKGNKVLAEFFYNKFAPVLASNHNETKIAPPMISKYITDGRIKCENDADLPLKWLYSMEEYRVSGENIGAIVMNCNPFTKGHLFLVETALSQVDFLYLFVVEEDESEFSFSDRFAMVKENCGKFDNVRILPSGKYMISKITFAEYFSKNDLQDNKIYPAKDARIFARYIAPFFNITKRFVGSEPLDKVTNRYNETMKELFPYYGIKLIEIPRMTLATNGQQPINATLVRKLLKSNNIEACKEYLTNESYDYIKKHCLENYTVLK